VPTPGLALGTDIPYPGLAMPHSQLAVPILAAGRLLGVLFVESPREMQFGFEDEDVLVAIAGHLGSAMDLVAGGQRAGGGRAGRRRAAPHRAAQPLLVRRYPVNDSIFINDTYLIKGVAGAIFWKLVRDYMPAGPHRIHQPRTAAGYRLGLPDITDNLEARLLLLQRRLAEHALGVRIEKTGRGRFRLLVQRPLELVEVP
jgi:adenylate cyclase